MLTTKPTHSPIQLANFIGKVFIIAYKESTKLLEEALIKECSTCEVLRQEQEPEYKNFSPSYLCLLNHRRAWEIAAREAKPTLIVEADFVPVIGFGKLPLPFNPHQNNVGISWLYTCAPRIEKITTDGYTEGYANSTVAYIITPQGAKHLIDLANEIKKKRGTSYSSWDGRIDRFLRDRKLINYLSFRNYGEHGGLPNPEHYWRGLSKTHRADVLYGKLAFMPMYALNQSKPSQLTFFLVRLKARLKGIARIVVGKFLPLKTLKASNNPGKLLIFVLRRQLSLTL